METDPEPAAETLHEGWVPLIGEIWAATTRLGSAHAARRGGLKGSSSLKVEVGRWLAEQVLARSRP